MRNIAVKFIIDHCKICMIHYTILKKTIFQDYYLLSVVEIYSKDADNLEKTNSALIQKNSDPSRNESAFLQHNSF